MANLPRLVVHLTADELLEMMQLAARTGAEQALARHAQPEPEPKTMSLHATASELGAHPQTIRRWIRAGKLRARRSDGSGSGRLMVDVGSIREFQGLSR